MLDLVHPLPLRGVPLKGKREIEAEDFLRHTLPVPFRRSPLVAGATTFPPIQGALWVLDIADNLRVEQQRRENHTTGLRPWKCTPFGACGTTSPGGGSFSGAMPCDTYGRIAYRGIIVPPLSGVAREHDS